MSSGFPNDEMTLEMTPLAWAVPRQPCFHHGGEVLHRARLLRIDLRACAEVGDDTFKRLNLGRELTRRGAITAVLDPQRRVLGAQLSDFRSSLPAGAEAHQHGHHQDGSRDRRHPRAN
jgi:hypothetical protein